MLAHISTDQNPGSSGLGLIRCQLPSLTEASEENLACVGCWQSSVPLICGSEILLPAGSIKSLSLLLRLPTFLNTEGPPS